MRACACVFRRRASSCAERRTLALALTGARLGSAEIFSSSSFVQHNFRARGLTASGAPHVTARRSVYSNGPQAWPSSDTRPRWTMHARHVADASRRGRGGRSPGFPLSRCDLPYFLSSCASRPARCEGSGKARATAAARTPIATKVTRVPAECVALNLDTPMACRTAHSAVLGIKTIKMAIAHSARRVLSPTTANAGRHVTAQRSTDLGCTLAMRSPMRANIAKTTTDACRGSVARTTIVATVTRRQPTEMDSAAFIARGGTEPARNAARVQHALLANASTVQS